jgi:hypothetical protein
VEIIARVSERDGRQRALDVWVHKATRAGLTVVVESTSAAEPGPLCGIVDIEGLRYRILHDKRVRQRVAIVPAGQHPIEAVAKLTTGEPVEGLTWTWHFVHAAWAEPLTTR